MSLTGYITAKITAKITSRIEDNGFGFEENISPEYTYIVSQNGDYLIAESSTYEDPAYIITTTS